MKKRLLFKLLLLLVLLFSTERASAYLAGCPYLSQNSTTSTLSQQTQSLLSDLQASKEICGGIVDSAIESVNNLNSVLGSLQDPAINYRAEKENYLERLAEISGNTDEASRAEMDYLFNQIEELDSQIRQVETLDHRYRREEATQNLAAIGVQLIDSIEVASHQEACRTQLGQSFTPRFASMSLGLISTASPLLFPAGAVDKAVGGASFLLGKIVNLFNSMPSDALSQFERKEKTFNLACLYHAVITNSCGIEEKLKSSPQRSAQIQSLNRLATCDPNHMLYANYYVARDLIGDINPIFKAIGLSTPALVGLNPINTSGGSEQNALSQKIQSLMQSTTSSGGSYGMGGNVSNERLTKYQELLSSVDPLVEIFNAPENEFLAVDGNSREFAIIGLEQVMSYVGREVGLNIERNNGGRLPWNELKPLFLSNIEKIKMGLQSLIKSQGGGSDSTASLMALNNLKLIHQQISKDLNSQKIDYLLNYYDDIEEYINQSGGNSEDLRSLRATLPETRTLLEELQNWINLDPNSITYEADLQTRGNVLRNQLRQNARSESYYSIQEEIDRKLAFPFQKLYGVWTLRGPNRELAGTAFDNPFNQSREMTPFEKVSILREAALNLRDQTVEDKDLYHANTTRELFEESGLGAGLKAGLQELIKDAAKDTNPDVSRRVLSELCALSYSLPEHKKEHAIEECAGLLPTRMNAYLSPNRENASCSYFRYYRDSTRTDRMEGNPSSLPIYRSSTAR